MARVKDWERKLIEVEAKHAALPFQWGVSDCFQVPLDGILAVIGRDPWPGLHDYDSEMSAAKCLVAQGYRTLADAFTAKFETVPLLFAGRGDVAIVESEGALCGALFVGTRLIGKTQTGLQRMPREAAKMCFRVQ